MAVSIAERVSLLAVEIHRQFDLERRRGVPQIHKREIGEDKAIGDLQSESARIEVERLCFIENADHGVDRFGHSMQFLEIRDDSRTIGRLRCRYAIVAPAMTACGFTSHASSV